MTADLELVDALRSGLRQLADPSRAPQMQAYMKSAMPYLGVRVPQVRALVRSETRSREMGDVRALHATVDLLWNEAGFREERYAATELLSAPATRDLPAPESITLYERLIVEGAWWDHVDELSHRVGDVLRLFPDVVRPVVVGWQDAPDLWLRRSSIICQLSFRQHTDLALLSAAIDANADSAEFFLRKAIGWALRDYARTDPDWVRAFVDARPLSPLSRREALKHLD